MCRGFGVRRVSHEGRNEDLVAERILAGEGANVCVLHWHGQMFREVSEGTWGRGENQIGSVRRVQERM